MRLHHLAAFSFLPVLTLAHFTLLEPGTVYTVPYSPATVQPCGFSTLNSNNTIDTGITGNPATFLGLLALTTHGSATWTFSFILGPFEFDLPAGVASAPELFSLYRTVQTTGDGKFCLTNAGVSEDVAKLWREGGTGSYKKKGWVSVKGEMDDGTFYQCANVFVQSEIPLLWPTMCANDTNVSVRYKDDDGTDTSGPTPTATGPSVGPGLPTPTIRSNAPSMSGAPIDNTSASSGASTTASTGPTTTSQAVVPTGAATGKQANSSMNMVGIMGIFATTVFMLVFRQLL